MTEKVAAEAAASIMETAAETLSWAEQVEAEEAAETQSKDDVTPMVGTNLEVMVTAPVALEANVVKPPPSKRPKFAGLVPYKRPIGLKPEGFTVLAVHGMVVLPSELSSARRIETSSGKSYTGTSQWRLFALPGMSSPELSGPPGPRRGALLFVQMRPWQAWSATL